MTTTPIRIEVSLDWPSYEDDINTAIRNVIIQEVQKEVRKYAGELREAIHKEFRKKQAQLVARAVSSVDVSLR